MDMQAMRRGAARAAATVGALLAAALLALVVQAAPAHALTSGETGSVTLGNLEAGTQVEVYKVVDVNWDDAGDQPVSPAYTWTSAVAGWVKANYPAYVDDSEGKSGVAEAFGSMGDAASKEFYDKLAAAVSAGTVALDPAKTFTAAAGGTQVDGLAMGGYLVLASNSANYVYQPIGVNIEPVYDTAAGAWKLAEGAVQNIEVKRSPVGIEKTVNGQKVVGAAYGEALDFALVSPVPAYPENASADAKKYGIFDMMDAGLTFDSSSLRVYGLASKDQASADAAPLVEGTHYTVGATNLAGEAATFALDFDYESIAGFAYIRVEYQGALNENAPIGPAGTENHAKLEFNDDPYDAGGYATHGDSTKVYSYGIDVTKVDKADGTTALAGAKFTVADASGAGISFAAVDAAAGHYRVVAAGTAGAITELEVGSTDAAKGRLVIDGLAEGDYSLAETQAPGGYTKPSRTFSFAVADADARGVLDGKVGESQVGYVTGSIENAKGFELPTTGDMGTMGITALGVAAIAAALAVLVRMRRGARR